MDRDAQVRWWARTLTFDMSGGTKWAKPACEPRLLGGSNDNRSLDIALSTSAHERSAGKTRGRMTQTLHWGLTFDMSGGTKAAKPALGRPLDGGVRRRHGHRSTLPCE